MSSYDVLAEYYDDLFDPSVFYNRADYILNNLKDYGIVSGTILDLGCGTGKITFILNTRGYDVIGVDSSENMLTQASYKLCSSNNVSLIKALMQDYVCEDSVNAVICTLDGINHLEKDSDVLKTFSNAYLSLKSGGAFIFDVNTIYKHKEVLADNSFIYTDEDLLPESSDCTDDFFLAWDNFLFDDKNVHIYLDFFIKQENGMYKRFKEDFCEYAYSADEITSMLREVGFNDIKIFDDLSYNAPKDDSERICFICKKD